MPKEVLRVPLSQVKPGDKHIASGRVAGKGFYGHPFFAKVLDNQIGVCPDAVVAFLAIDPEIEIERDVPYSDGFYRLTSKGFGRICYSYFCQGLFHGEEWQLEPKSIEDLYTVERMGTIEEIGARFDAIGRDADDGLVTAPEGYVFVPEHPVQVQSGESVLQAYDWAAEFTISQLLDDQPLMDYIRQEAPAIYVVSDELARVTKERDELLAALEAYDRCLEHAALDEHTQTYTLRITPEAVEALRRLIAKAKGEVSE